MGSVFVTFATCRDAEDFYRDRHHRLIFRDRKLKAKWQREFFRERAEFNDDFDKETIETTIYVSGFDKIVRQIVNQACQMHNSLNFRILHKMS